MLWDKKNQSFAVDDGDGGRLWGWWGLVGIVWDDGETVTLELECKCWQLT